MGTPPSLVKACVLSLDPNQNYCVTKRSCCPSLGLGFIPSEAPVLLPTGVAERFSAIMCFAKITHREP